MLAEFFDAPSAEDARTLALLREGIAVMLHARLPGTARRVSLERLLGVCGDKLAALQGRIR